MKSLDAYRSKMREHHLRNEQAVLDALWRQAEFSDAYRAVATKRAVELVIAIRNDSKPGLMEVFLAEYGLSTDEGIALMCLAEALLRVPDHDTIDALIEDKIAPSQWGSHLGKSSSSLVNASTWALMLTGKVLQDGKGMASILRGAVKRMGEPVIRTAVGRAMRELGAQFVLGETIAKAVKRGKTRVREGYTYSYDMLGEAALTAKDTDAFYASYADAIDQLAQECGSDDIRENPGISIKLSALHPRYEVGARDRVMGELVPRTLLLARKARDAGMGLNIDAEEADRLDLSLDVIEAVLSDRSLAGWDGFGVVVQAYGKRAGPTIDWLHALALEYDRKIMVRLVKGAYWDTEIKRAQVEGVAGYPVFTQKVATDVSYICCAAKLLSMTDRIYPQFATHNAHSVAAILEIEAPSDSFEFQRLHGMGAALHDIVMTRHKTRCRIYAPVGAHEDLLAYLVRRLLENGANSSFVNQIVDASVPPETVAADPYAAWQSGKTALPKPRELYEPERVNSTGWDLHDRADLAAIDTARDPFRAHQWQAGPIIAVDVGDRGEVRHIINPARPGDQIGEVMFCTEQMVEMAIAAATKWADTPDRRAQVLNRAADLYEANFGEFFAVLTREAGKTPADAIAELREAVDFLRYYAARAIELDHPACGVFTCVSPWNFPLAIFTGQLSAALAAGNAVLAKPAESTTITATLAVRLLHEAGVPRAALQLLPGRGDIVGAKLTSDPRINGVCFTGSTGTAQAINRAMAQNMSPAAPLIAETGGLNAMIVDSTALPEQAVRDIVVSAFRSAGQRCSALRVLYVQEDVADGFLEMLYGAMDELLLDDPWKYSTNVGPVIDAAAQAKIRAHIDTARADARVLKRVGRPDAGSFVAPCVIRIKGISELTEEVFGPVLHVARFKSRQIDDVIAAINASGYGLTFGLHTRIDDRVQHITGALNVGNIYVNRNQIGAIVGSQPFGGEGLSGTGPKAGGPAYVPRFTQTGRDDLGAPTGTVIEARQIETALAGYKRERVRLSATILPGPTGESNVLSEFGRGLILCLGPTRDAALAQAKIARENGCTALCIADGLAKDEGLNGRIAPDSLASLAGIDGVASQADDVTLGAYRKALAARSGPILPLMNETDLARRCRLERHICVDTTAAGGNASLLAEI